MSLEKYQQIQVDSGNRYFVRSTLVGLDIVSPAQFRGGVTVNRVNYFARAVFTLTPKYRGILELHAYRENFGDPTVSARAKLRAEIAEAAGIYSRDHTMHMIRSYSDALIGQAVSIYSEAKKLEDQASDLRSEAAEYQRQSHDVLLAARDIGETAA